MMARTTEALKTLNCAGICFLILALALTANAKPGQGNMLVSPTSINAGSITNYQFRFTTPKKGFSAGSQATLLIPLGWSAPQTNNAALAGFVRVTPVMSGSTAVLDSIGGSGPWTLTIDFSTSQSQGGFTITYQSVTAPTNSGVYVFTTQSKPSGGVLTVLRSGSPTVTVNSVLNTNTTTALTSTLNPCTYGDWVSLTATVSGAGTAALSGTVSFKVGDVVLGAVPLETSGQATLSTNRFAVADSPCWLTAVYSGNATFNPSVSTILYETVNPAGLTVSGLAVNNKVYDGGTGAVLNTNSVTLVGALAGDAVTLDTSAAVATFADPNAGTQKPAAAAGLALQGADSSNYTLNAAPALAADITPAPLLVSANNTNKLFGAANPAFTATYSGFVPGEGTTVLQGAPLFSTAANASSSVAGSPYPIVVTNGTLTAANYSFSFASGWLTVQPGTGQPQKILSISLLPSGAASLVCAGAAGQTYLLQAASVPSGGIWTNIGTNTTDVNGVMTCVDSSAISLSTRFYRTSLP